MKREDYDEIIALIKREVVPAIGCTEPIAVALCAAKARETLGAIPDSIEISLSANIYKNAMGVGIPNTGMIGLPIAVALGVLVGRSEYGLEVLRDVTPEAVERAKRYIETTPIRIATEDKSGEVLYAETVVKSGGDTAKAVIAGSHTNFVGIYRNGKEVFCAASDGGCAGGGDSSELTLRKVFDFATTVPTEDIEFLWESAEMNISAAEMSFDGDYGHGLGRMLHDDTHHSIFGDTLFAKILSYTSGACDARMSGAMIPVMSNSGSGNQGISATVPVVIFGRANGASHERILRALALSHLTVIYIKQSLGRLSALCGCVVAATGSSCGITYLMGGGYEEITYAVKNMVANLTGMICDGAKPSCSLKVTSGVATAVLSAVLAIRHRHTTSLEGIIDDDVDRCIHNLTDIGRKGMQQTDKLILDIMTNK